MGAGRLLTSSQTRLSSPPPCNSYLPSFVLLRTSSIALQHSRKMNTEPALPTKKISGFSHVYCRHHGRVRHHATNFLSLSFPPPPGFIQIPKCFACLFENCYTTLFIAVVLFFPPASQSKRTVLCVPLISIALPDEKGIQFHLLSSSPPKRLSLNLNLTLFLIGDAIPTFEPRGSCPYQAPPCDSLASHRSRTSQTHDRLPAIASLNPLSR